VLRGRIKRTRPGEDAVLDKAAATLMVHPEVMVNLNG
jgi:hypothetical protein